MESTTTPPEKRSRACWPKCKRITKIKTANIRKSFLEFFENRNHRVVPSSPVIPFDDPTLLFVNAGMNQFKDVFTGQRTVDYRRAASVQKCLRAGGKHNDLDNVGFTSRHHTFFEMLGNFSFGDYFKEEAILLAWEWVTKTLALPKERLWATVYDEDDEAFSLWEKIAPELKSGRILRFGKKENYWSMGETGPCGPCSEIHFDRGESFGAGPDDIVNGETERYVEIWNLVFMQFDQIPDGKVVPLPKPSVDTGAGLERIAAVMQDKVSNYETDQFAGLIKAISEVTGTKYDDLRSSHHVVADHLRALSFSLADGAGISNEGRGYVLRRILRRAARHGRLLGMHEPFMYKLVPALTDEMGEAYPELLDKQVHIQSVIQAEEESFGRTLETGLDLFSKLAKKVRKSGLDVVDGADVFKLYDTYGFPYDLTEILANEQGLTLDRAGFDQAMAEQQERSKVSVRHTVSILDTNELIVDKPTNFCRDNMSVTSEILAAHKGGDNGDIVISVNLDSTPFYVEAGGQISDTGRIYNDRFELTVSHMSEYQNTYVHSGRLRRGEYHDIELGATVTAEVDAERRWDIMRNHTATHLAHKALRMVLGEHVKQSGSYVGPDRLRFDFSHHQPMSPDEVTEVERIVNEEIIKGTEVQTAEMSVDEAMKSGAMALFGEKYGDTVRVVSVADFSKELCGGTHVHNVGQIGPFIVTTETGIASGVRRLEAITGRKAIEHLRQTRGQLRRIGEIVGRTSDQIVRGVEQLHESNIAMQKDLKRARAEMFAGGNVVGAEQRIGKLVFITHDFGKTDSETMDAWIDSQRSRPEPVGVIAVGSLNDKPTVLFGFSSSAVKELGWNSGSLAKEVLPQFGGRGGGKPTFARGSVAAGTSSDRLFEAVAKRISGELKKA